MDATAKPDALMPDLAAPIKVRRAPKHDFKDGNGRVFAHRHDNGGGWVADTAWVAPTVRVTRGAQVFGFARVYDRCAITGQSNVYGRAQLFDDVKLSQNASALGHAKIVDACELSGAAQVSECAFVSGTTHCSGNALIWGHARVHNTRFIGPKKNSRSIIQDRAYVADCTLTHSIRIGGAAFCSNAHITSARVRFSARVLNSTIMCDRSWEYHSYLSGRSDIEPAIPAATAVIDFCGTAIDSRLQCGFLTVSPEVLFANSTIYLPGNYAEPDNQFNFSTGQTLRFIDCVAHGRGQLDDYLLRQRGGAAGQNNAQLAAPVFQAPHFDAVRQRRVMRLEDNS